MPTPDYHVICSQNELIANDIYELKFPKPEGFDFKPGQFILFDTPLLDDPSDIQPRAYSIASAPGEDELLFIIKYLEGGRMSEFLKEQLTIGTELRMVGPMGLFTLKPDDDRDLVFICTSTGNAPFRSMIKQAALDNNDRQIELIYGVRKREDLFWETEFNELAKEHGNLNVHIGLSRPDDDWTGLTGHVQDYIPEVIEDLSSKAIYICGNPDMANEVKTLCLGDWGLEKKAVHVEGFI